MSIWQSEATDIEEGNTTLDELPAALAPFSFEEMPSALVAPSPSPSFSPSNLSGSQLGVGEDEGGGGGGGGRASVAVEMVDLAHHPSGISSSDLPTAQTIPDCQRRSSESSDRSVSRSLDD